MKFFLLIIISAIFSSCSSLTSSSGEDPVKFECEDAVFTHYTSSTADEEQEDSDEEEIEYQCRNSNKGKPRIIKKVKVPNMNKGEKDLVIEYKCDAPN